MTCPDPYTVLYIYFGAFRFRQLHLLTDLHRLRCGSSREIIRQVLVGRARLVFIGDGAICFFYVDRNGSRRILPIAWEIQRNCIAQSIAFIRLLHGVCISENIFGVRWDPPYFNAVPVNGAGLSDICFLIIVCVQLPLILTVRTIYPHSIRNNEGEAMEFRVCSSSILDSDLILQLVPRGNRVPLFIWLTIDCYQFFLEGNLRLHGGGDCVVLICAGLILILVPSRHGGGVCNLTVGNIVLCDGVGIGNREGFVLLKGILQLEGQDTVLQRRCCFEARCFIVKFNGNIPNLTRELIILDREVFQNALIPVTGLDGNGILDCVAKFDALSTRVSCLFSVYCRRVFLPFGIVGGVFSDGNRFACLGFTCAICIFIPSIKGVARSVKIKSIFLHCILNARLVAFRSNSLLLRRLRLIVRCTTVAIVCHGVRVTNRVLGFT